MTQVASPDRINHGKEAGTAGPVALHPLDHRDAIRARDPLTRLGGLTLEFVGKVVSAPMSVFLVADADRNCSLAEIKVDPVLTADPAALEQEFGNAITATVPMLTIPLGTGPYLLLDRSTLDKRFGFGETEFANTFMAAWGLDSLLVLAMRDPQTETSCVIGLYRQTGEPDFNEREKGFLRQIAPLLAQSWSCATRAPEPGDGILAGPMASEVDCEVLTRRELEIARMAAAGARNDEIARSLHITVGTVKTHVRSIYAKLGVDSRVRLSLVFAAG